MKNYFTVLLCYFIIIGIGNKILAATVNITVTQVDTFALRTMAAQPVLKININITGTGSIALQKLVINTLNQINTDVDSVAIYYSNSYNRFSLVDYPGESFLLDKRKKIAGDSIVLNGLSHILNTGDNYFWVTMDLAQFSYASHYLDAKVPVNGIEVGGSFYPSSEKSPSGVVYIAEIYYRDNFEDKNQSNEPAGWNQVLIPPATARWKNNYGGYTISSTGHPSDPKSGKWNIMLQKQSYTPDTNILVSGPLDLSLSASPLMSFYHAQVGWLKLGGETNWDELRVLYKVGATGSWTQLASYILATPDYWLKREVILPIEATVKNVYIGFKGITKYGWGVCVDSLMIYEKGIITREVKEIVVSQPNQGMIPQSSDNNPIVRVNIRIKGNTGNITLNSLKVTSNNTSDADVKSGGVKLYYSPDSLFLYPQLVGTGLSFSGGTVTFSGLSRVLETGNNYYWVTYDVTTNAYPGHLADAYIKAGDIGLSSGTYPASDESPEGSRRIKQTLFYDDFEGTPQWDTTGEFQIHAPMGLGGTNSGMPDPTSAYSGTKVLGTDLTGLGTHHGDYENSISAADAYTATSPLVDAKYFKNVQLSFYRYLNLDNTDSAFIEYQLDTETSWKKIWTSSQLYYDTKWRNVSFSSLKFLDRKKFNLRFVLGPTDAIDVFSGWNIDYLFFTGDSIPMDAAISRLTYPVSNCDLSASEHVKVWVVNTGPKPLINTPIYLSLNGGQSWVAETIAGPIALNDSLEYTFTNASDFSHPAIYKIIAKVKHPLDNFPDNDSIVKQVIAYPTYNLPYSTGFEQDTTFWISGGINSTWSEGWPSGSYIYQPYQGVKCWKTDYSGYDFLYENSYVESPCFTFTGKTIPMIDVMFNHDSRNTVDGAILQYSLDKGQTWTYAREDSYPFNWNWYNDTVTTLKHKGWTGRSLDNGGNQEWKHGRQILPPALAGQSSVKFRFVFKSDSSTTDRYEGFAFDTLTLQEAPYDVGVKSIDNLVLSACQHDIPQLLKVTIKNYGVRDMAAGQTMIVGVKTNSSATVIDTFPLGAPIPAGGTLQMMLDKPVNLATAGSNTAYAFTLIEKDPYYYDSIPNDTAKFSYTALANPVIGLPDSVFTARIDTLVLTPVQSSDYSYFWRHSTNTATTSTYAANDLLTGTYYITVTSISNGCITKDSVGLKMLIPNVGITQIIAPVDTCAYVNALQPVVRIYNFGTDTVAKNKYIPVHFRLNTGPITIDSVKLLNALAPKNSYVDTLNKTLDLSVVGNYNLWVCTKLPYDTFVHNDTMLINFDMHPYPTVNLGADRKINAYTYTLDAGSGFKTYSWSKDAATTQTIDINAVGDYSVTVTNTYNCPDRDTVHITLTQHDIGIKRIISPVTSCTLKDTTHVKCKLENYGTDTIRTSDVITMKYRLNSGSYVTQTYSVPSQLLPNDSITFTFTTTVDMHVTKTAYNFVVGAATVNDLSAANDSIQSVVNVWGNPNIDLGPDAIVHKLADTLEANYRGFKAYRWQDNSTDSTYIITRTHNNPLNTYSLTVTDYHGCQDRDTVNIYLAVDDVSVTSILSPGTTSCATTNPINVGIRVTNTGNMPVASPGKDIIVKYKLNNDQEVTETMVKFQGSAGYYRDYYFTQTINLDQPGVNQFKAYINMSGDLDRSNDTLSQAISVVTPPVIDFGIGNDDSMTVRLPYTLDAGAGAGYTYKWKPDSLITTQTYLVTQDGFYQVTVTDASSCSISRGVHMINRVYDLSLTKLLFTDSLFVVSDSLCPFDQKQRIGLTVKNAGNQPINNQLITIKYQLNGGTEITKPETFSGITGDSSMYYFDDLVDLSLPGLYLFAVSFDYADDNLDNNNNTFKIHILDRPVINFGAINDTIKTASLPIPLDAGAGSGYTYLWNDNVKTQSRAADTFGCYKVTVTNSSSCTTNASVFVVYATLVHEINSNATLVVFPNPVRNILYVNLSLKTNDDIVLELVSTEGRTVLNRKLKGHTQYMETIDVRSLPKGMYFIRVYHKDWVVTDKVMVQ